MVDLDGLKVRPNHTRCTVILREIPDDTQIHEVEVHMFSANKMRQLKVSCCNVNDVSKVNVL